MKCINSSAKNQHRKLDWVDTK